MPDGFKTYAKDCWDSFVQRLSRERFLRFSYPVILLTSYLVLLLYKKKIIPSYQTSNNVLRFVVGTIVCFFLVLIVSFVLNHFFDKRSEKPMAEQDAQKQLCKRCSTKKLETACSCSLEAYDIITFTALLDNIEGGLVKGDDVIIYTALKETEKTAAPIVKKNCGKGVKYRLVFYEDCAGIDKTLYADSIDLSKIGLNKGIDFELSKETGFDVFCVKRHNGSYEAYFAVNYSTGPGCKHDGEENMISPCINRCDYENKYLFYKRLNEAMARWVYKVLDSVIKERGVSK